MSVPLLPHCTRTSAFRLGCGQSGSRECSSAYLASLNCDYFPVQLSIYRIVTTSEKATHRGMSSAYCFVSTQQSNSKADALAVKFRVCRCGEVFHPYRSAEPAPDKFKARNGLRQLGISILYYVRNLLLATSARDSSTPPSRGRS